MNFGEYDPEGSPFDNESDFDFASDFGFLGINCMTVGEVSNNSSPLEVSQGNSTQIGVTLNTHGSKVRFKVISGGKRLTLQWWKVYLDSCATYHTFFVKEFLKNIVENKGTMNGNCNAGETKITKRGYFGKLRVWLNENGIANLLSIPQLEKDGYSVSTNKGQWKVFTPEGNTIRFKRDTGMCVGMPYIDLRD